MSEVNFLLRNKNKFVTIVLILLFVVIILTIVRYLNNRNGLLVSPREGKVAGQLATPVPTSTYNPPKEIKYDSSTDLKKELDSVSPQVLDSDF